ncbi:hypothetical protein G9A89_003040 [Geosiphon pyriformis]|nr:hypothetical protein G9A89_003040 [Geosiphon pyriformis]
MDKTINQLSVHYTKNSTTKPLNETNLQISTLEYQPSTNQQLGLTNNHYPAESDFNFYVNEKITDYLKGTVNIESARENFYTELFQYTSLPRNYSFTPIIREINQTIERYTQQQFPITYTDKDKGRLQTPAVTPKQIQPPTWKKTRVESPTNLSYHYKLGSTINITLIDVFISHATSTFGQFPFQSKQRKEDLLEPYRMTSISATSTRFRNHEFLGSNKFRRRTRRKKKESEEQEFTYQNPIIENPEIETLSFQTQQNQNNQNSDLINQLLLLEIMINSLPDPLITEQQQQP